MKVVAKPIEVIAYFQNDGKINPIKLRIEEGNKLEVIKIQKITNAELEKLCGNKMWVFTCIALIRNEEKIFEIKYDIEKSKWILWKI